MLSRYALWVIESSYKRLITGRRILNRFQINNCIAVICNKGKGKGNSVS